MSEIENSISLKTSLEHLSLNFQSKIQIAEKLIDAFHHFHKVSWIAHLDLNPNNVLLDDILEVYIIDFGLARTLGGPQSISYSGMTPDYFAPEQILKELRPSNSELKATWVYQKTDIY